MQKLFKKINMYLFGTENINDYYDGYLYYGVISFGLIIMISTTLLVN